MGPFVREDIVVCLVEQISISGTSTVYKGEIYKVGVAGSYNSKGFNYVIGFIGRSNFDNLYDASEGNFRKAEEWEIDIFLKTNEKPEPPRFNPGTTILIEEDVTTTKGEFTVRKGETYVVEDTIINPKDPDKSLMWFSNHPGVFYMSDFK